MSSAEKGNLPGYAQLAEVPVVALEKAINATDPLQMMIRAGRAAAGLRALGRLFEDDASVPESSPALDISGDTSNIWPAKAATMQQAPSQASGLNPLVTALPSLLPTELATPGIARTIPAKIRPASYSRQPMEIAGFPVFNPALEASREPYVVDYQEETDEGYETGVPLCSQVDPELFFPERGGSTKEAKAICNRCEIIESCLQYALESGERFGVWGGKSERERRKILNLPLEDETDELA